MAKVKTTSSVEVAPFPPAVDPDNRLNQLCSLAVNLVEQRLLDGTASSQETTHFLKLCTPKARIELELLEADRQLKVAKTEALQSAQEMKVLYDEAIKAMRNYAGQGDADEYDY